MCGKITCKDLLDQSANFDHAGKEPNNNTNDKINYDKKIAVRIAIMKITLITVDSEKLEHGCRMIYAGFACFFDLALEDGHDPTFWSLLYDSSNENHHDDNNNNNNGNEDLWNRVSAFLFQEEPLVATRRRPLTPGSQASKDPWTDEPP